MDTRASPSVMSGDHPSQKRKRSVSLEQPTQPNPPAKVAKMSANHLHINYLARQYQEILPLISADDTLPSLLTLIADYDGVLQRHESMAGNLGARPLGPILIQRFERLFDGPPRVLKTHGKEGTTVGWLDVVEFARNKPEQFNLEKSRDGVRVCQFYTKQCRVEISEDDFDLISSGIPQKMIPPQPISEDEEKELGTLEILEKSLGHVVHLADQVSARARQLNHRLKNRRNAIISRRESERIDTTVRDERRHSPDGASQSNGNPRPSVSPTSGFVAVNAKNALANGSSRSDDQPSGTAPATNGTPLHGASAATRAELMSKFYTNSERTAAIDLDQARRTPTSASRPSASHKAKSKASAEQLEYTNFLNSTASPVPIPNTPSSLLPYVKPSAVFDDSGPYKADMMLRMEQLNRGDRVQPPCDRCRRLHMDCLKNLTACMGCTRKHAKCSWKDVEPQELKEHPLVLRKHREDAEGKASDGEASKDGETRKKDWEGQGVRDEELLGEEESDDEDSMPKEKGCTSTMAKEIEMEEAAASRVGTPGESTGKDGAAEDDISGPKTRYYTAHEWDGLNGYASIPAASASAKHQKETRTDATSSEPAAKIVPDGEDPVRVYTAGSEPLLAVETKSPTTATELETATDLMKQLEAAVAGGTTPFENGHVSTPRTHTAAISSTEEGGQLEHENRSDAVIS